MCVCVCVCACVVRGGNDGGVCMGGGGACVLSTHHKHIGMHVVQIAPNTCTAACPAPGLGVRLHICNLHTGIPVYVMYIVQAAPLAPGLGVRLPAGDSDSVCGGPMTSSSSTHSANDSRELLLPDAAGPAGAVSINS